MSTTTVINQFIGSGHLQFFVHKPGFPHPNQRQQLAPIDKLDATRPSGKHLHFPKTSVGTKISKRSFRNHHKNMVIYRLFGEPWKTKLMVEMFLIFSLPGKKTHLFEKKVFGLAKGTHHIPSLLTYWDLHTLLASVHV